MISVPLIINGQDFQRIATSYAYVPEITYDRIVTTQDGTEHPFGMRVRPGIEFTVMLSREHNPEDYKVLTSTPLMVEYDHPDLGWQYAEFRLDCNLEKSLAIRNCVDGANYYESGSIRLRALEVL